MKVLYGLIAAAILLLTSSGHTDKRNSLIAGGKDSAALKSRNSWSLFHTSTRLHLNDIHFFPSSGKGYISGRFLMEYDGTKWAFSLHHPPSVRLNRMFVLDEKHIWTTNELNTNESDLYFFNGKEWSRQNNPFANHILAMDFDAEGKGWIGGDREIAYHNGRSYEFLPYPGSYFPVIQLYGKSRNEAWALTMDNRLYHFNGERWLWFLPKEKIRYFHFDSPRHGYAISDFKVFEFNGIQWRLHSYSPLLEKVKKIYPAGKQLFGCGQKGLIVRFDGSNWTQEESPVESELNDIQMISESEGWIVGNNGTILHYSPKAQADPSYSHFGFETMRAISIGKDLIDEYGIAMEDLNNDGLKDIYSVCLFNPHRLYLNSSSLKNAPSGKARPVIADLQFTEEASLRGITGINNNPERSFPASMYLGVGMADMDNDSDQDLYLCNLTGRNKVFLNNGRGYFRNVSGEKDRASGGNERTNASIFADVDSDGDLDMFITNENSTNRLFVNDGNAYFTDITSSSGLETKMGGMGAAFADIDQDGDPDLCIANWGCPNKLFINETSPKGSVRFREVKNTTIAGPPHTKCNAVAFADYDNDGDLDLFITCRKTTNRLYENNGRGEFKDVTEKVIGLDSMLSYGASFADFDQDGYQDLYIANAGKNVLYRNISGQKFIKASSETGAESLGYGTGTASGDIDNDGDIDLYAASYINASSLLYINKIDNNNFILLDIRGTHSNRDAVGTKVTLFEAGHAGDKKHLLAFREISAGSGYCSHSSREVHFGVSPEKKYDIVIYFPSSKIKKIVRNIRPGIRLEVNESEGLEAFLTLQRKASIRFITDPDVHFEMMKFLIIAIFLFLSVYQGKNRYRWEMYHQYGIHIILFLLYWTLNLIYMYDTFLLSTFLPLASVIIPLAIIHLIFERIVMVKMSRREKEATRTRIARDLHDDIASTLSSAVIYLDTLKRSMKDPGQGDLTMLEKINRLLTEASEAITDIVWTVSPRNDRLEDLIVRLRVLVSETARAYGFTPCISVDISEGREMIIEDDVRRNIFLIFKEALSNAVRHSKASSINFTVSFSNGSLLVILDDDGRGFDAEVKVHHSLPSGALEASHSPGELHGHGLVNILSRAGEIGAGLAIESAPMKGTKIILTRKMI